MGQQIWIRIQAGQKCPPKKERKKEEFHVWRVLSGAGGFSWSPKALCWGFLIGMYDGLWSNKFFLYHENLSQVPYSDLIRIQQQHGSGFSEFRIRSTHPCDSFDHSWRGGNSYPHHRERDHEQLVSNGGRFNRLLPKKIRGRQWLISKVSRQTGLKTSYVMSFHQTLKTVESGRTLIANIGLPFPAFDSTFSLASIKYQMRWGTAILTFLWFKCRLRLRVDWLWMRSSVLGWDLA